MSSKVWDYIVLTVVVIGAIIYAIVGLGGLYLLSFYGRIRDFSQE